MKNILKFDKYQNINEDYNDTSYVTPVKTMNEYFLINSEFALKNKLDIDKDTTYDITDIDFKVIWDLNIDSRNWGIKDLSINIKKIIGVFTVSIWTDEENKDFQFTFNPEEEGYRIKSELEISSSIAPSNIEIDFKNKTITVS